MSRRGKLNFTPDDRERISALRGAGVSLAEVSRQTGWSVRTICRHTGKDQSPRWTKADDSRLRELRKEDKRQVREIAEILGRTEYATWMRITRLQKRGQW